MKSYNLTFLILEIPQNIRVRYCKKNNQLTLIGMSKTITIFPTFKFFFKNTKHKLESIHFVSLFKSNVPNNVNKKSKALIGSFVSIIQQIFIELTYASYQKLKLVGVGYRAFSLNDSKKLIMFKLGYSHFYYYGLPEPMGSFCFKFTKLYIHGNVNFNLLKLHASKIRKLKSPEPYKGKGILYWEEIVKLKIGKRV